MRTRTMFFDAVLCLFTLLSGSVLAAQGMAVGRGAGCSSGSVSRIVATASFGVPRSLDARPTRHGVLLGNPQRLALLACGGGIRVIADSTNVLGLRLVAYRQGRRLHRLVPDPRPEVAGPRISVRRGSGLTEWYLDSPRGIEQGFTLDRPAADGGSVSLAFELLGPLQALLRDDAVRFASASGGIGLRYGDLRAYDARHRALPARMELRGSRLTLVVDTAHATFPVTIDPLFTSTSTFADPEGASGYAFGNRVALSADGSTAIVSAGNSTATPGGAVYVYTQSQGQWSAQPVAVFEDPGAISTDAFGSSIALSADGSIAIVGAYGVDDYAGAAYVYVRMDGSWSTTPAQVFEDPAGTAGDYFGDAVAISGDGTTAIVAAPQTTTIPATTGADNGAVYAYQADKGSFPSIPSTRFTDPNATLTSGAQGGEWFGSSVAISSDGNTLLVGADSEGIGAGNQAQGAAYIFKRSNGSWSTMPSVRFADPGATSLDYFGVSAALSGNGTTAAIAADGVDTAVYLFNVSNDVWTTTPSTTFTDPGNAGTHSFGFALSLSSDASMLLVGSPSANSLAGAAYLYTNAAGTWSNSPVVLDDPAGISNDFFGASLALSGTANTMLASAWGSAGYSGAVYAVSSTADLTLSMGASAATVATGDDVTFAFDVTNTDSQVTVSKVTLKDTLPAGMRYVSASTAGGSCSASRQQVTCTLPSLAPQGLWQPGITVATTAAGSLKNTAVVTSEQADPDNSNNSASTVTTVTTSATSPATPQNLGTSTGSGGGGVLGTPVLLLLLGLATATGIQRRQLASRSD